MSLSVMSWVLDESEARLGARLVLLALAEYAHDDGTKAFPSVETLSRKARLSERGARDALRKLEADKMIVRTGATKYGTNVYTVTGPFNARQILPPGSSEQEGGQNTTAGMFQTAPDPSVEQSGEGKSVLRARVRDSWLEAPGLIRHRDSYFTDTSVQWQIDKALAKYGVEDLLAAIKNYSFVLESSEHFFKHSWTLKDFLQRGLDRFVSEAHPEKSFQATDTFSKVRSSGGKPRERKYSTV